jgi:hypothetical protein
MADQPYILSKLWADRLQKMWNWQRSVKITGAQYINSESNLSIAILPSPRQITNSPARPIHYLITGYDRDSLNWRWNYQITLATNPTGEYDDWVQASGAPELLACNLAEMFNTTTVAAGQLVADLPDTWEPQPTPIGQVVEAYPIYPADESDPIYQFTFTTEFTGACEGE